MSSARLIPCEWREMVRADKQGVVGLAHIATAVRVLRTCDICRGKDEMIRSTIFVGGFFMFAATVASADGQVFGQEAGWNILKSDALGGCFMEQTQESGIQVQFGINGKRELGYVALFVREDLGLPDGDTQIVNFNIDGDLFDGEGETHKSEGFEGGFLYFNNPDFINDIIEGETMVITTQSGGEITVDLKGTKAAGEAVLACQTTA